MSPLPLHSCPRPPWTNRAHPSSPTRGHPAWQSLHVEETKCPAPCSSDIQDWFCIERRAGINLFPFLSSGLSGSPPTSSRLIHLEISPATLGANRRDRSQPSARRRLWVSPAPHQEAQGQAPLPAPPSIIPRTRAPSPMQGPDQLGAAHRLPAPSLRIHMETEGRAGHTKTGASFVLHTQRPQNKAPCRQPGSRCLLFADGWCAHTLREANRDATKLFCKNPNCAPLVPPPEQRRAGYNQESLQLRVTSDSLCYLPCPATVPAGRLTAARPRLEQRALPAWAHPRTGDAVGLPQGSNTQKYLLCQRVPAAESQSPVFRGILSVHCCLLGKAPGCAEA